MNIENPNIISGAEKKINEYVERILNGENKESVLQGLSPSFISAVEKKISHESGGNSKENDLSISQTTLQEKTEDQMVLRQQKENDRLDKIEELRTLLGANKNTLENLGDSTEAYDGIENIKQVIENVGATHYLFTHQTDESTARSIFESQFHVSPGTGISSTMTWLGADGVVNQIERQLKGDAHRGYKGMAIVAIPKEVLDAVGVKSKADALEQYLMEHPSYGQNGSADLFIPKEYNLGYLEGSVLNVDKNFVKNDRSQEVSKDLEPAIQRINDLVHKIDVMNKKQKEISDKTKVEWDSLYGKMNPLSNQQLINMNNQSAERFWDWVNYESGNSPERMIIEFNEMIEGLRVKYDLDDVGGLEVEKYHSRSTFDIGRMKEYLEVLQKSIKNGLKEKILPVVKSPEDYDASWLQI